jgi:ligand-binding sensor domain-containing protein/signal transduction histidine kinase
VLALSLVVCHAVFLGGIAKAQEEHRSTTQDTSATVARTPVKTATVRLPIIDGTDIRFTRMSTANVLSQTQVSLIVQDDQGFIWFATQYGLIRYDGYNIKVFSYDPGNPSSLNGVAVRALFKDRTGALWIGCDQFLNKLDPVTETFTRYPIPFVTYISQDSAGELWSATPGGLYSLDPTTGRIRRYSHDPNNPSSLGNDLVIYSGEDREGRFWVAVPGYLDEFDRGTGKVTRHIPIPDTQFGFGFYEDRFGVLWIFHVSPSALSAFDPKTNTLTRYVFPDIGSPGTAVTRVTSMIEDRNGTLWVATHGPGLLKFDREHGRFTRYRNDPADPDSLPQNDVDTLFADREGSIWAGLGSMGPIRFATDPLPFKKFVHSPHPNSDNPFVGAIYEDKQGILWVGTPEALNRIDRKAGRITSYRHGGPEAGTDVIAISEDRSGYLWVGTYGHGLLRFDRRTGQFKTYRHNPDDPYSLSNDFVSALLVDHNGTLWAGVQDGLNRFDEVTEGFMRYKLGSHEKIACLKLVEDGKGILWLGTDSSGLHRFDPATGQITVYQHEMNGPGTLSDNLVNSVHFDRSGTLWVGTQDGLNKLDPKTGKFTAYTKGDGLPGIAVSCVLEDDHGDLWMSTNNGVANFDPQRNTFKSYSTVDGLPGPDLTGWGACYKSMAGEMFFGGFNGATAFFPDKVRDGSYAPPIVLTDLRLFGSDVAPQSPSLSKKSISYTDAITLTHNQNIFSIQFSGLSYLDPATNRYRYMLEGLNHQWNQVGSDQRVASYSTLPAGIYTFRVQGATIHGPWSEPGAQLWIEILPPWWGTLWFRATLGVLLLFVGLTAYKYRLHQIARAVSTRFDERLAERTRMARDLHDTFLQTVQGTKLIADHSRRKSSDTVQMHRDLDELSAWLDRAIEEGRAALNSLRISTTEKNDLAYALQRATMNSFVPGTMAVKFPVNVDSREMHPVVRDEVYRIGYEAIRNACLHSAATQLEIELTYGEDLALRVADNGVGIDSAVVDRAKDGHFGLQGMRERAIRIGGKLTLVSSSESGTEIKLVVPGEIIFQKPGPARQTILAKIVALVRRINKTSNLD